MPSRWILPDGIADALPPLAQQIEHMRRQILDLFHNFGYAQIITPHVEFLQSLLTDAQADLDLHTFKLADPISGQMLGLRADITPQAARIDAHNLKANAINRLCYIGSVIHTKPRGLSLSRCPIQVGAELYGDATLDADIEIICLMLQTLQYLQISDIHLELAHVGIFQSLIEGANITADLKEAIFKALQQKDGSSLAELTADLAQDVRSNLQTLNHLCGGAEVLTKAQNELQNPPPKIAEYLAQLTNIVDCLQARYPNLPLHIDLAESRGFHYHTGLFFAAFVPQLGQALAQGGRYDGIGKVFGAERAATGFSADLKTLVTLAANFANEQKPKIWAEFAPDITLWHKICELREQGKCVIQAHNKNDAKLAGCTLALILVDNKWQVLPLL